MKVDLTKEQLKQLDASIKSNKVCSWLEQKESMKFEIGDVLIKNIQRYDYESADEDKYYWAPENINSDNKMNQRYVYIYETPTGVGFIKKLRVSDGTLGEELFCLADFDYSSTRFEVDPEYAEHMLLDANFDIRDIHKKSLEARKIVTKMNRKIGVKPKTLKEYNEFYEGLAKKAEFWLARDFTGKNYYRCKLSKLTKVLVKDMDKKNDWSWKNFKENNKDFFDADYIYLVDYTNYNYGSGNKEADQIHFKIGYRGQVLFNQEPAAEDKKK